MAGFDTRNALNLAIRALSKAALERNAGGWVPPKEQERRQREAMRQEQQQARQAEKEQKEATRAQEKQQKLLSKQYPTHYMPNVGRQVMNKGGMPDQPPRQLSPMGFYSAAAERAQTLQPSGDAVQMINALKNTQGIKTEELQNAGLIDAAGNVHSDWAGRGKVTREDLVSHLQGQMPQVEETVLGGKQSFDAKRLEQLQNEYSSLKQHPIDDPSFGEDKYDEMIRLMNIRDQSSTDSLYRAAEEAMRNGQIAQRRGDKAAAERYFREYELLNVRAEKLDLQGQGLENPTKYSQYTLPGGENYREVLLRYAESPEQKLNRAKSLVDPAVWARMTDEQKQQFLSAPDKGIYQSPHWKDPNVLAHIRMSDRTGPNGEKILHVEELQSDWGQKGKKTGFESQRQELNQDVINKEKASIVAHQLGMSEEEKAARLAAYNEANARLEAFEQHGRAVPDAPYVTSTEGWTDLALKRVLKEAAEGGYDKVVWTPGAEQAKRYDLSKQIDSLKYSPAITSDKTGKSYGGNLVAYKDGHVILNKEVKSSDELEGMIGKDVANKLLQTEKQKGESDFRPYHYLEGADLSVGGEGMKGYYDNIVPKRLQSLAKKHDKNARLGYVNLGGIVAPNTELDELSGAINFDRPKKEKPKLQFNLPSLDITPAMRESILRGQSAYKRGGTVSKRHPALSIVGTHIREEEHGEPIFTGRL